jgi:AraC-like DNA-binding protein
MKPQFEHVTMPKGCSIRVFHRQIAQIPFEWHHHPECELTLTLNSRGMRFIADHVAPYDSRDLVLVPSEMPHTWASTKTIDEARPQEAVVVWFTEAWALQLADVCPEYTPLRKLLTRAGRGLSFAPAAGERMQAHLADLLCDAPRRRLVELADADGVALATQQKVERLAPDDATQLNRILNLLHKRFAEPLRVKDLCNAGNMSERSLHRLFVRHLGENVSDYLGRLRIGRACMWLVETDRPISVIAADAGFTNLANFNRQFRSARNMTPKQFRRAYLKHGMVAELEQVDIRKRSPSLESARRDSYVSLGKL